MVFLAANVYGAADFYIITAELFVNCNVPNFGFYYCIILVLASLLAKCN